MGGDAPQLDPQLERSLVHELRRTWLTLNVNHFRGALRMPAFSMLDARSFWARWIEGVRTIEVSRRLVLEQPWTVVVEVLKHEMAHQFVSEVLKEYEVPHGPAFQDVCERLGIDARASGLPQQAELTPGTERIVQRVSKLLALAQSDNQHEAEAAAAAAQRMMLKHNLERSDATELPQYGFRQLGRVTGRVTEWERRLGNLLGEHFFVDVIWVPAFRPLDGKRGSVLEVIGSQENLELAEYVHGFLSGTAERLWTQHKKAQGVSGNKDRRVFMAGVMAGFADKLAQQAERHAAEGLVWVPEAGRSHYTRRRHPYVRNVSHGGHRKNEAFGEGRKAGREIVLHRGMHKGSGRGGRLLPSGR